MRELVRRIEYAWRLFATGAMYLVFGLVGIVFSLLVFPPLQLALSGQPDLRVRVARNIIHHSWGFYLRLMVLLGVITLTVKGREILEQESGAIVIANHPSLLDIVILISIMKNTKCIVKQGVWNNPFMRSSVRSAGYIPNTDDPDDLIAKCRDGLASGSNLIIFPEGSRSVPGQPMKFQRGFAHLALRTGAPLRLVHLECDPPTLLKGQKWYDIPPSRSRFRVTVGERLDVASLDLDPLPSRAVRQLTNCVTARYKEFQDDGSVGN